MAVDRLTYTISEAAAAIGIGRSMLHKLINDGGLRTVHIGKRVLIPRESVLEFLGMEAAASSAAEKLRFGEATDRAYIVNIRPIASSENSAISRYA